MMSRDRDYIVAGIESLLAKAKAEVRHLEIELRRRAPKSVVVTVGQAGPEPSRFVRSAKARANMSKAQKAVWAAKRVDKQAEVASKLIKAEAGKKR